MDATAAIADLDAALAAVGETIRLVRLIGNPRTGQSSTEVACRAMIRGYAPSDLANNSGITQQDQQIIVSPTAIRAADWPGPGGQRGPGDPLVPRQGDRVLSNRGVLTIQAATGLYLDDTLVRIEIQARGT
jgi:hypothetical protein